MFRPFSNVRLTLTFTTAEFGGATDLLIGFSFFTVFQLGELLVGYWIYKCCRTNRYSSAKLLFLAHSSAKLYKVNRHNLLLFYRAKEEESEEEVAMEVKT